MSLLARFSGCCLAALCIAALAGCRTTPLAPRELPTPVTPPAAFTAAPAAATTAAPADGWLATFGDPALGAYVDTVLAANLDLAEAAARLANARHLARLDGASLRPNLAFGFDASRSGRALSEDNRLITNDFTPAFTLRWEVDLWGRLQATAAAATASYQASRADYAAARLSLAARASEAWFASAAAARREALARETVRTYDDNVRILRDRYASGTTDALDLRLVIANAEQARALLAQREREAQANRRALQVLATRYPDGRPNWDPALPTNLAPTPAGLPAALLARRPDLVAAERRWMAASLDTEAARDALLPSLTLTGRAGTSSSELENITDMDFSLWSVAAGLTAPIFSGGALRARRDAVAAEEERTRLVYLRTALTAFQEVENALAGEALLRDQLTAIAAAAEQSIAAEELAWDQYRAGLIEITTVLEAQRRALNARESLIDARLLQARNRLDLHLALGGDFTTPPLPLPPTDPHLRQPGDPAPATPVTRARR